jgi:large subunit ribosomal protein L9
MKVVFVEDVPSAGEIGDIKEVADGYARNYLIPKKLAVLVDSQTASLVEARLRKKARLQAQIEAEMTELAKQLEGKEVVLKAKAGTKERLYGSITNADIAEGLEKSTGLAVDKRKIDLEEPIREVGSYEIAIRLTKDIIPKIKLRVEEEEKKEEGKEKAAGKAKKEKKEEGKEKTAGKAKKEKKTKKAEAKQEEAGVEEAKAEETPEDKQIPETGEEETETMPEETPAPVAGEAEGAETEESEEGN